MLKKIYPGNLFAILTGLSLCAAAKAQVNDSVKINAVPYKLFWENTPVFFQNNKEDFIITAGEKTEMFRDPGAAYNTDNAPKLMFVPDSDFVLIASIEHVFTSKWDGGAIVIKADNAHWIKFCFEKDYTGAKRVVSVVTKETSDDCNSVALSTNKVFYKVAKADNVVTLYYSPDGSSWFLVRHVLFDVSVPVTVGFLAQSPTGKSCMVKFSGIRYTAKKINDPYLGE